MPVVVNVTEAKAQLSRLLAEVEAGAEVVVARSGRPVAIIRAYEPAAHPRRLGAWKGKGWIGDDFDEPLPTELQQQFE